MTVIIGYTDGSNVWMAGDTIATEDSLQEHSMHPKIFTINIHVENGEDLIALIGYTGSFRMGQLLQYTFKPPTIQDSENIHGYMCSGFVQSVLEVFEKAKILYVTNNQASGGTFLIGIAGSLFCIQDDFSVMEYTSPFTAIGCGIYYALGSLMTSSILLEGLNEDKIKKSLELAILSACTYSPHVKVVNEKVEIFKV